MTTDFWLKSKIYFKKVAVMKNNTLAQNIGFLNINSFKPIQSNIQLRKLVDSIT